MKLKEISVDEKPSFSKGSGSLEVGNSDIVARLAAEQKKNDEIKKQLSLEKARADRLQKKVQFIQDNQDLFNQLKEVYVNINESHGKIQINKAIQDVAIQTNAAEYLKSCTGQITAVNKQDLAEVAHLVRELKSVVAKGGRKVFAAIESEKHRDRDVRKKIETENQQLKRELYYKTSELERLRSASGTGPREVSLLRRIVAKMILGGNNYAGLNHRECQLAKHIAKKYEIRQIDNDRKILDMSEEEDVVMVTPFETPRTQSTAKSLPTTPKTPRTPNSAKDIYGTPRWIRGEDVP